MKHYSRFIMLIIFIMVIGCSNDKVIIDNDPPDNDGVKKLTLRILVTTTEGYFVKDAEVEISGYFERNRDILVIIVGWTDSVGRDDPLYLDVEEPKDTIYVNVTKDGYHPADTSFRIIEDGQDINLHLKMQEIQP
jgi:hypothetical protein